MIVLASHSTLDHCYVLMKMGSKRRIKQGGGPTPKKQKKVSGESVFTCHQCEDGKKD